VKVALGKLEIKFRYAFGRKDKFYFDEFTVDGARWRLGCPFFWIAWRSE
jgi:hypothetical protein